MAVTWRFHWIAFMLRHVHTLWFYPDERGDLYCPKCLAVYQGRSR